MKTILLSLFIAFSFNYCFSQFQGVVYGIENNKKSPLFGVTVKSITSKNAIITSEDGSFAFNNNHYPDTLVFLAIGYYPDTLIVTVELSKIALSITLYSDQMIEEVVITARKNDYGVLKLKTLNVETIGEGEIRKAACCNLSEAFQTNTSVDVTITDAVSGAKKISMMGLDGVYAQIQLENIPYLRGLESSFGLSSIPGTWIESIQITKGTGSVVNGYESMAGLINLELKKPDKMEKLFFNAYVNHFGRSELNFDGSYKLREKISGGWFVHGSTFQNEIDQNKDGFRDINNSKNFSVLNRWKYEGKKMVVFLGINAYRQNKFGGQVGYSPSVQTNLYGSNVNANHIDAFAKTGFMFKNTNRSLGIVYNLKYQTTDALFGVRNFSGIEKRAYINTIYEEKIGGSSEHILKTGASFVYSDISQNLDSLIPFTSSQIHLNRVEFISGLYAEYSLQKTRLSTVFGARVDYNSLFGIQVTPRLYGKYKITENIDFRFTGGKGFRTPNVIIDNISLLASSRKWFIDSKAQQEISWNYGGSIVYDFFIKKRKNTFTLDLYRTQFVNQLIVDRDISIDAIYFRNIQNQSFSNTLQAELNLSISQSFDFRVTYKHIDVQAPFNNQMRQQVMVQKNKWLTNLSYRSKNKKWEANCSLILNGKMRMTMVSLSNGIETKNSQTPMYPIINGQVTYIYKKWDFYIGGENLGNFKIKYTIVDPQNPFTGAYFDATCAWAPVFGTVVYGGIRYKLKQQKH
ncbi:MAG: TonB-dependent receptor plug domain-containing protein [Flavobacteriia bacterium]|nr:TonB-dependent receptor plug domain-containing protein [Flavobacteriia bacterium]